MSWSGLLRRMGIYPGARRYEIEEADSENTERNAIEHREAVRRVAISTNKISDSNQRLRESIDRVKSSSSRDTMADLVHGMKSHRA